MTSLQGKNSRALLNHKFNEGMVDVSSTENDDDPQRS
jgi:hypothetical protein